MAKAATTVSLDTDILEKAQALFDDLGVDLSTACNMFLHQAVYEWGIPFSIHRDIPNAETLSALEEGDRLLTDPYAPEVNSVEELLKELND